MSGSTREEKSLCFMKLVSDAINFPGLWYHDTLTTLVMASL